MRRGFESPKRDTSMKLGTSATALMPPRTYYHSLLWLMMVLRSDMINTRADSHYSPKGVITYTVSVAEAFQAARVGFTCVTFDP